MGLKHAKEVSMKEEQKSRKICVGQSKHELRNKQFRESEEQNLVLLFKDGQGRLESEMAKRSF